MPDVTGNYYASRNIETYKSGTTDKTQLSYWKNISSLGASWRGVQALGWDDNNPFICLPSMYGSTGTTYFGISTYGPYNSSDIVTRGKIHSGYTSYCGLTTFIFEYNFSSTSDHVTSRLVKY